MVTLFVYYKVRPEAVEPARAAALRLAERIGQRCGRAPRLMRRTEDPLTWMEIYEAVEDPGGLEAILADELGATGLDACLVAGRHVERFTALEPTSVTSSGGTAGRSTG